jgi:hypothetical protein
MKHLKTLFLSGILLIAFMQAKAQQVITLSKGIDHVKECSSAIKDAIAANDGVTAQNKAKDLLTALNEVPVKYMTPKQASQWTRYVNQLQSDSKHISEVSDVADQKQHFTTLAANLQVAVDGLRMK